MKERARVLRALARGLLAAIGVTLAGMLVLSAAILFLDISDRALYIGNQLLKLLAILTGVRFAVGVGGEQGLVTGAVVAAVYMICGYASYCALGGAAFSAKSMLAEIGVGALIGAAVGMLLANLKPRRKKPQPARRSA